MSPDRLDAGFHGKLGLRAQSVVPLVAALRAAMYAVGEIVA